jgi:hypothetical protein
MGTGRKKVTDGKTGLERGSWWAEGGPSGEGGEIALTQLLYKGDSTLP